MTKISIDVLFDALESAGAVQYGTESVTELEHALQIAELADKMSGDDELTCAALLHDIGRVAVRQDEISDTLVPGHMGKAAVGARGHDEVGAALLGTMFSDRVVAGVKLHVAAKRYLCTLDPAYYETLSEGSITTMKMQGGLMNGQEFAEFKALPYSDDALQIRRWDDMAKVPGLETRPLEHWRPLVQSLMH